MTEPPVLDQFQENDDTDESGDPSATTTGGPPSGGQELGDDIAQEAQTGISSPDADEHQGEEAPASEGRPRLD
jgi:hypothetical protein